MLRLMSGNCEMGDCTDGEEVVAGTLLTVDDFDDLGV